jgi:hypothetical protein
MYPPLSGPLLSVNWLHRNPGDEAGDPHDEAIFLNLEKPLTSNPDKLLTDQTTGRDHVGHYQLDLPSLLPGEAG